MKKEEANLKDTEFVKQYIRLKVEGLSSQMSFEAVVRMGYSKSHRQLNRQIRNVETLGNAISLTKRRGTEKKLCDEAMHAVERWVTEQNSNNIAIQRKDVQRMIYQELGIQVSVTLAGTILCRLNFTARACSTKTGGFKKLNPELKREYWDFILMLKAKKSLSIDPAKIHSLDVTHTRKPPNRPTTFAKKGKGKQRSSNKTALYTDSIVTCISADGRNSAHACCSPLTPSSPQYKRTRNEGGG